MKNNLFHSIFREPLFHFLILGGLIFILYDLFGKNVYIPENNVILVTNSTIENLTRQWSAQMGRPVTEEEITGFIDKYIREEILSREAKSLGLDDGDIVIKRRLVQKIEFMSDEMMAVAPPSDKELENYFENEKEKYALPRRISFTQIYLKADKEQSNIKQNAESLKETLNNTNEVPQNAYKYSHSPLLKNSFDNLTSQEITNTFGNPELFDTIWEYSENSWQGPVESSFGWHLVFISSKTEKEIQELNDIKDIVVADMLAIKQKEAKEQFMEKLKSRYVIHIDEELKPYYQSD